MTREYFKKYLPKNDIILEPSTSGNHVTFILHIPPAIVHAKSPIRVLYTMLEGDTVPDSWYQYLTQATHILVPTTFVRDTFKKAGFDSTVLPLGYDADIFKPVERVESDTFTFLHYEAFQDRKGWEDLLDAWIISGLAQEEEKARLIFKSIKPFTEIYEKLKSRNIDLPGNVKVICGELPHQSLFDILSTADCFVFPSRGEGFSLPPLEAMATGLPVILSKGHSHMDYYNEDYMYGVDSSIKIPARYSNWEDQGDFVRCNVDALAHTLKHVYNNREEARSKGRGAVEYVSKYSYDVVAKNIADYLCQIQTQ